MKDNKVKQRKYVSANVIADYLNLSPLTLGRWRSEKRNLPYYVVGGAIKYDLDEIVELAERSRVSICAQAN